jgi:hypothetical protein
VRHKEGDRNKRKLFFKEIRKGCLEGDINKGIEIKQL